MGKGGLFLCSIGLLIVLFSANQNTGQYNGLNMVTGITLIIIGLIVYRKTTKNKTNGNDKEVK